MDVSVHRLSGYIPATPVSLDSCLCGFLRAVLADVLPVASHTPAMLHHLCPLLLSGLARKSFAI